MALLLNANDSVNRSYTITKPSPNHPLDVNGVGVRSENLFDGEWSQGGININGNLVSSSERIRAFQTVQPNTTYTFSSTKFVRLIYGYNADKKVDVIYDVGSDLSQSVTFTTQSNCTRIGIAIAASTTATGNILPSDISDVMLNAGSTPKPYEPYGYKIPISSPVVTTNIYLGSTQTVRQVKKIVFDGTENWSNQNVGQHGAVSIRKDELPLAPDMPAGTLNILSTHFKAISNSSQLDIGEMVAGGSYLNFDYDGTNNLTDFKAFLATQYANGTPVIVYYVLATPETAAVNEPLMKIGDYADTLSNATAIPTTEGANSITVDTTVQPSEFTATWTGWHDASVKEYDGSQWNE